MKTQFQSILVSGGLACVPLFYIPLSYAQPPLQEVVVISSRIETPVRQVGAAVSVVNREEIALRGYASVADLLRTQPGIAVSNAGGAGKATALRIRGEEGHRTLVMIDGVDISDPTGTQVGPQIQHLGAGADIQRVEILRGPQGFIYGADAGGVINIITRTAEGFASELMAEAGRFDSQKLQGFLAAGGERISAFVSANHRSTDGFNSRAVDISGEADGYRNLTLHGKFGARLSDAWRTQLVVRDTDATSEYDNSRGGSDYYNDFQQSVGKLSLAYDHAASTHLLAVAHTSTNRSSFASGQQDFATDGSTTKLEYVGSVLINPALTVVLGGDAENEEVTGSADKNGKREYDDRDQLGLFSEAQTNIDDAFYLSAGLRIDDNEDFGEYLSSRIASAFVQEVGANSSIKYRASWGTGFRAPSLSEIFYNRRDGVAHLATNVTLKEEVSEGFDLGVELYSASGYTAQFAYFDQKVEDEIYYDKLSGTGYYFQGDGISHSRGVELAVELPIASHFAISGNYTYNDTLSDEDRARERRPRHLANLALHASAFDERVRALINLRMVRDAVDDVYSIGRVPLDDYQVVDISAQYRPLSQLTLFARLENAANEQYQEITGFNTSGRAFYAGVKYVFD